MVQEILLFFHGVNLFTSWHIIFSPIQLTPASWEWSQEWRPSPAKRLQSIKELSVPEQPSWSRKMGPVPWPNCDPLKTSTPSEVGSVRYWSVIVNTVILFPVWPFRIDHWNAQSHTCTFYLQFSKLTAYYYCFFPCKSIITDSTPGTVDTDFYSALGWIGPSN